MKHPAELRALQGEGVKSKSFLVAITLSTANQLRKFPVV